MNGAALKMKNVGAIFEYEEERNMDLMRAYREQLASHENKDIQSVFNRVVEMPSKRFWVSEERAAIVISEMIRGKGLKIKGKVKREMYHEIFRRVNGLKEKHPDKSVYDLTFMVVTGPAPKFYLTPGSAKVIIHKVKKQWYEERKRKLQHCLW